MAEDRITALTGTPGNPLDGMSPALRMLLGGSDALKPQPSNIDLLTGQSATPPSPPPQQQAPVPPTGAAGEFVSGVEAGARGLIPQFEAVGGLAAKAFGYDQIAKDMLEAAKMDQQEIDRDLPTAVTFDQAFASPGNFVKFAARNLGEQTPIIASIILGGGVGSLVGRLVGRGALTAAEGIAGASRFGAEVGAIATSTLEETGSTGNELYGATGEVRPAVAFSAGIAKGALEAVVPLAFARRFGIPSKLAEGLLGSVTKVIDQMPSALTRTLAGAALGTGVEGATEMLQEAIDVGARSYVDKNYDAFGPAAASRILQAGFTGALVGGILGGVGLGHEHGNPLETHRPHGETPLETLPPDDGGPKGTTPVLKGEPPAPTSGGEPNAQITPPTPPQPISAALEETPSGIPAKPDLRTEATDQGLHQAFAVVGEGETPTVFHSPMEAQFAAAQNPQAKTYALTHEQVINADTTVALRHLPAKVTDENVDFPIGMEAEKGKAVAKIQQASDLMQRANEVAMLTPDIMSDNQKHGQIEDLRAQAAALYQQAVDMGARIRPENGQGFQVVSPIASDSLPTEVKNLVASKEIDNAPKISSLGTMNTRVTDNGIVHAVTKEEGTEGLYAQPTKSFAVNTDAVEKAGGTVTSVDTSRWINTLGRALDVLAPSQQITPTLLKEVVNAVPEVQLNKKLTRESTDAIVSAFKRIRQAVNENTNNSSTVQNAASILAENGITLKPKSGSERQLIIAPKSVLMANVREVPAIPHGFARNARTSFIGSDAGINAVTGTDIHGNPYSVVRHKPGTAVVVPTKMTVAEAMPLTSISRRIKGVANELLTQFGLSKVKLLIQIAPMEGRKFGSYVGFANSDISIITINSSLLQKKSKAFLVNTLTHEFGHLLVHRKYGELSAPKQQKIYGAYQRAMLRASMGNVRDLQGVYSAVRTALKLSPEILDRSTLEMLKMNPNYDLSFDEYLAEQVSRYFTNQREPLTHLERWFKGLAVSFKKLYAHIAERFGFQRAQFVPDQQVKEWLDAIKQNVEGLDQTPTESEMTAGEVNSNAKNFKALDIGTPDGEIVDKMEPLMDFAGVKEKDKKTLVAGVGRINWLMKWFYTIRQLTQINPNVKGLRVYNELIDRWALTKAQWQMKADGTIKQWRGLSRQSQDNLAKFIYTIDAMDYLKKGEQPRMPTKEELLRYVKEFNITAEGYSVYQRMRQDLVSFLDKMQEISVRDVTQTVENPVVRDLRIAEIQKEFDALRARPYFPHSRFGDFTVVVKDEKGKTKYMEQFASRKDAQRAYEEIAKEFPGDRTRVDKIPEEVKPFRGLPPTLLNRMLQLPGITEQQKTWIEQLKLDLAPTQSFRKRLMRRQNVAGYSLDAMRSYANYMWHGSNYLARIEFQGPLQESINSVHAEASDAGLQAGKDVSKLREIADFMQNHMDQVLNPAPDWAQLRSIAFMWWLGFSPAAAFTNLTQNAMTTYPYLASRHGDIKALGAMRRAIMDIQRIARGKTEGISDAQVKATQRAVEKGITDESFASELAATSEGHNLAGLLPGNKFHRFQMEMSHWAGWMYQSAEKFNRRVAFAAAWRLAMENPDAKHLQELRVQNQLEYAALMQEGYSDKEAMAYLAARDSVWTTQFQYSAAARPRILRGKKGSLLAFFSFVQNSLYFASHDKGRTRFLLMMMLMGGLMGMPGAQDVMNLVRFMTRKLLGEDVNIEKDVREFITNITKDDGSDADMVLHGISRTGFGVGHVLELAGLPGVKFDMSANIGMGNIIPGISALGPPTKSFSDLEAQIGENAAGAVYGIGLNVLKFLSDDELPWMDGKRYERALPRSVKAMAKAYRFLEEGRERSRSGDTVIKFDASDPDHLAEITAQALGFTPTRLAQAWDRKRMQQESIAFWSIRRQMLMQQFNYAYDSGDRATMQNVAAAIRKYNNEIAIPGYGISNRELRASRMATERRHRLADMGLPPNKRDIALAKSINQLYPNASPAAQFIMDSELIK